MDRGVERARLSAELARLGVTPRRWRGQNFLLDRSVAEDAVRAAGLTPEDSVLEIGPGLGILTAELVRTGARVVAVELEPHFVRALRSKFRDAPQLTVVESNLFEVHLYEHFSDGYTVVANLPYSITGLALRNLLTLPPHPIRLVLLLQREVAERIAAPIGKLSILGVMVQAHATVSILREVPPGSFWPEPEVFSSLVRLDHHPRSMEERFSVSEPELMRVVRLGFSARRKLLKNNLAAGLGIPTGTIGSLLESMGIAPGVRAQEVSVEQWAAIAKAYKKVFDRSEKK